MGRQLPWVLLFTLAVLAASLLFVPETRQLALVRFKAEQYTEALASYEAIQARGDLSAEAARGLAQLYIHYGEVSKAIDVVERYLVENPNDQGALARLATYYQYDQRYEDYRTILERLRDIDPHPDTLRKLSRIYNRLGLIERQIRVLQKLVALPQSLASDAQDLATLLAGRDRIAEAIEVLQQLRDKARGGFAQSAALLLASLHIADGHPEAAIETATAWLRAANDPEQAGTFGDMLNARGGAAIARRFLTVVHELYPEDIEIEINLAASEAATGEPERGLSRLTRLNARGDLPGWGVDLAVGIALQVDRLEYALALGRARPRALVAETLRALVATAVDAGKAKAAHAVVSALGSEALSATPVLAARLAISLGQIRQANDWADRALSTDLGLGTRFELVEVLVVLDRRDDALAHLTATIRRDHAGDLPGWALRRAAGLYINYAAAALGRPVFADVRQSRPETFDAAFGWAMLAVRSGRTEAVRVWWAGTEKQAFDNQHLDDLFYAARAGGADELALAVANLRVERRPDPRRRRELAMTQLATGRPLLALAGLRTLVETPDTADLPGLRADYVAALIAALAAGAPVGPEATDVALDGLAEAPDDTEARAGYVNLLISAGSYAEALPYIARLVDTAPQSWVPTYMTAAREAGRPDKATALLDRQLRRRDLPRSTREQFAYNLLELDAEAALPYVRQLAERDPPAWRDQYLRLLEAVEGRRAAGDYLVEVARTFRGSAADHRALAQQLLAYGRKAAAVEQYKAAAAGAPPDAPVVGELLWLWGPRPPADGLAWLADRLVRAGDDAAQAGWAQTLVDRGAAGRVLEMLAIPSAPGRFDPLAEAVLAALRAADDRPNLRVFLTRALATAPDTPRLQRVGDIAFEAAMSDVAAVAYDRVLARDPTRPEAVRNRGQIAFFRGDWERAERLLTRYLAARSAPQDFRSRYQLAEIHHDRNRAAKARQLYTRALAIIDAVAQPSLDARITRALILRRTDDDAAAERAFADLVADTRARRDALPHYLRLLLDNGRLGRVGELLLEPTS